MSIGLYTALFALLLPFILIRMLFRSIKAPQYRERIPERIGLTPPVSGQPIWIHAVSVGEVVAISPVIERLLTEQRDRPILVTTTTPTGAQQVDRVFGSRVAHRYLPWDLPLFLSNFFRKTNPRVCIIVETELWPNLLAGCKTRGIPVLLANARLSERSAKGYARFSQLSRLTLSCIDRVCAQHELDAQRFVTLGLPADRVRVTGSIKFDAEIPAELLHQGREWRAKAGSKKMVWIAASTHQGEDEIALRAWENLTAQGIESLLVLVPRHPERFDSVYQLACKYNANVSKRSDHQLSASTELWIGDTLGELPAYYEMSDVAFVGGSFSGTGGHNPLEPALLGKPILMGPSRFNFQVITDQLRQAGALTEVEDEAALTRLLAALFTDPSHAASSGAAGQQYVRESRGALDRLMAEIRSLL